MSKKLRKLSSSVNVARWASYATAGAAVGFAAANDAEASIFYSGAINVTVSPHGGYVLNTSHGHGSMAFPGYFEIAGFSCGTSHGTLGDDRFIKFGGHQPNSINAHFAGFVSGAYLDASKLASNLKVSAQHFTSVFGFAEIYLASHLFPPGLSEWRTAGTGFLGFEFKSGANPEQYGWARITTTNSGTSYTIVDYAIGSPGQAISTGETAVPEPATLGLLAIGALGLLANRRGGKPNTTSTRRK